LADLRPPAELAGSYRRYVATRRRLIGLQPIAKPGDDPRAYTRDRLENANVALARRLGFRVCH
jgi:hypothetical protein